MARTGKLARLDLGMHKAHVDTCGYYCSADVLASTVVAKYDKTVFEVRNPKRMF